MRYHKQIYIPKKYIKKLQPFTDKINTMEWRYTKHSIDNIKYRSHDIPKVLQFIKSLVLNVENIFEIYSDNIDNIIKVCYRIPYDNEIDIILIINKYKEIITIYYNSKDDKHYTLKKELYNVS